jgi:hypothetical protein
MHPKCYDCKRFYGDQYGFPDLLIQKSVWKKISPTGDEGGLLCPSCIICRLEKAKLSDIPATFVSGPLRMVDEDTMKILYFD